jgi:hypothetical protein
MKSKILLLIATVTVVSITRAQSPAMYMGNKKIPFRQKSARATSQAIEITKTPGTVSVIRASSPITIDYTSNLVPPSANDEYLVIFDQQMQAPTLGGNKAYDFGNLTYESENTGTNLSVPLSEHTNQDNGTVVVIPGNVLDFNGLVVATLLLPYFTNRLLGLYHTVVQFTAAKASLKSITGVVTDSLTIPYQTVVFPQKPIVQMYPTTNESEWVQDNGKGSGPTLFITLASEGLKNAPVKMVREFHFVHKIVGWGEVRIPTAYGPSDYFPCLLDKVAGYQNFKLYVNGRPASKAVSNIIFGSSNNQQKQNIYYYQFMKKGYWDFTAVAAMDMDSTFTTVLDAIFDETYLKIDCANNNGVNVCSNGHTNCVPYANNLANNAMLKFGATLGACDDNKSLISELGENAERVIAKENKPISPSTRLKIFPNPVTSFTNISFSLPQCQKVSIQIFDMMRRLVTTLADAQMTAGTHQFVWNSTDKKGRHVNYGVYLLKLSSGNYTEAKMLSLVK